MSWSYTWFAAKNSRWRREFDRAEFFAVRTLRPDFDFFALLISTSLVLLAGPAAPVFLGIVPRPLLGITHSPSPRSRPLAVVWESPSPR